LTPEDRLAGLSPVKRALVERLLREKRQVPRDTSIPRRSDRSAFVLSSAQLRLWFLHKWEPESPLYNSPLLLRLCGELDGAALQRALNALVVRHEVLRTVFDWAGDYPVQRPVEPYIVELSRIQTADQNWASVESRRSFDFSDGIMLRAVLQEVCAQEHLLLLVVPHIASDGWSRRILMRDLCELYNTFSTDRESTLPPLPIQYGDYACWQQERLSSPEALEHLEYWKRQLSDMPVACSLFSDRPRPAVQSYLGSRLQFHLPPSLCQALEHLGQQHGATLFMTLLTAFHTLIYRYTGQTDVIVGTPIAGRGRSELEDLIGCFINTLVIRTDLSDLPTFSDLLLRVRKTCLEAYDHQVLPFEKLVEELKPDRDPSRSPLVQVLFVLQNTPRREAVLNGLTLHAEEVDTGTSKFDLSFNLESDQEGIRGSVEFSSDLFDVSTIGRFIDSFQTLLESAVIAPESSIASIAILTDAERQRLLFDFNDTYRSYPKDVFVHQLFEEQVERSPDAIAVSYEAEVLTYAQLNARANQLAHHLCGLGVKPDTLVAICMDRSVDMVVGVVAVLKAGGAYVPLDPEYPADRLAFMLSDLQSPVLLTQQRQISILPNHAGVTLCLDTDWGVVAGESTDNPQSVVTSDNLAYVIYTSGSTGRPKGAMNTHGALANRIIWMQEEYGLNLEDKVLLKTPFTFDVSVWEFVWTLMTGARIVIARPGGHRDAAYLCGLIESEKITTLHFVPSMLQYFLAEAGHHDLSSIKRVICSGEALSVGLKDQFYETVAAGTRACLHNLYGPTEAAIDVTYYCCDAKNELQTVPIGRPIANTQIYILNSSMEPVPIGAPGELYIAGVGLARGYLNRDDLTADKFIPNPIAVTPSSRLYKSGDLARYLPDGNIEFLGRIDHQVKIRGFRIELGEVESVLAEHEQIQEAVAIVREDSPGNPRLVVYIIGEEGASLDAQSLRVHVRAKLPEYMVPSAFVFLESLPVNSNGKLDRKALPEPDTSELSGVEYSAPQDSFEERLCSIWAEVLKIDRVGVRDNFFDLGGHSLLAIRLLSLIGAEFGSVLSLAEIFGAPTVSAMAAVMRLRNQGKATWSPLVPLKSEGTRPPLFCAPVYGGSAFYYRTLASYMGDDRPMYALEPIGLNGVDEPHKTIEEMAAYYITYVRSVQPIGPYSFCGLSLGGVIAYEMAQQLTAAGDRVEHLILFDTRSPGFSRVDGDGVSRKIHSLTERVRYQVQSPLQGLHALSNPRDRLCYAGSLAAKLGSRIANRLRGQPWKPSYVHPNSLDLPEFYGKVIKAEQHAKESYRPESYGGHVVLLSARVREPGQKADRALGWSRLVSNLEVVESPGNHFTMLEEPCVHVSAKHVRKVLDDKFSEK